MRVGIVLGAGGTVGLAYHCGVLKALDEHGISASSADLLVGTSAGSVMAAYLRSGFTPDDMWSFAQGTHPRTGESMFDRSVADRRRAIFSPMWSSPGELVRRGLGSAFVV